MPSTGSSLALQGLQLTTPWITVADGKGRFLSHLTLSLTASGGTLSAMRWDTLYVDEEPPPHIIIGTVWDHAIEEDLATALGVLYVVAAALVLALAWRTCTAHGMEPSTCAVQEQQRDHRGPGQQYNSARPFGTHSFGPGFGEHQRALAAQEACQRRAKAMYE